jgi:predicted permease
VLGATGGRLIAEQLTTTLLLALGGTIVGLGAAAVAIPALIRFLPTSVPRLDTVHFGEVTLIVGVATGVLAALVLAVVPALDQRATDTPDTLHGGARLTRGVPIAWVIIAEAATAVVLTIFAGLTLRSFDRLSSVDVGFDPSRLMAFRVSFEGPGIDQSAAQASSRAFFERLRAVPGVVAAGRTSVRPFYQGGTATTVTPPGLGDRDRSAFPTADIRFVDAEYFRTLGLTALSGHLFSTADARPVRGDSAQLRVVVNETFGKKLWPGERNLVGRRFDLRLNGTPTPEIIGVVRDVRMVGPRNEARPTVYIFTEQQTAGEEYDVLVRTSGPEAGVIPGVRQAVQSVAVTAPIFRVESMRETVGGTIARERATAQLLVFFAASALLLVAVGVYGLYAGEVTRRRREIGVRMALGATSTSVVRSMLGRALARTAAGVVVGIAAGFLASRVLESVLYGVQPSDPLSYAGAAVVVVLVAFAATLIPALQASAVTPSLALRAE